MTRTKSTGTKIFVKNQVVGTVEGEIFNKRLKKSQHFLTTPPAIAFDLQTLYDAQKYGATTVHIEETEHGRNYWSPISRILKKGFMVERGFGRQIALPMELWDNERPGTQPSLFWDHATK